MARISLRSYIHEIEGLVDKGQVEEAIAHCRHILQSFPKLLAVYRLMGKALLETRQYTDAADIFQRVLSSTPDDFVSQVGMSIIREDEGNMDAAIWHMERAFEVQPYNVAIQDELRRLYGRRDGVEPPKVRLTRGALARMYAKGNLYQQAIAELRAGLMEDNTRVDLQVVLARMYFQSRQRVEAVDTCSALLKKFPYCLEANRILSIVLPETGRKEDTQVYRQRVQALDPYLVHADPGATTSEAVPENIVLIESLDYQKTETGAGSPSLPAWAASLGVNVNEFAPKKEEEVPDWLASIQRKVAEDAQNKDATSSSPQTPSSPAPFIFSDSASVPPEESAAPSSGKTEPVTAGGSEPADKPGEVGQPDWIRGIEDSTKSTPAQPSGEFIPDWMKEAGWVPSAGVDESKPSGNTSGAGEPGQAEGEITKADLPDWLKAMAPEGALEEDASPPEVAGSAKETPLPPETGDAGLPDWLNEISPSAATEEPTIQPEPAAPVPSEAEIPAWLQEIPAAQAETPGPAAPAPQEPAEGAEEIPDWLQEIGEEKGPAEAAIAPVEEKTTIWEEEKPVEIPVSAPLEESVPGVKPGDQDAALAWLESLAAKQGASEEELTTRPEERQDTPPTWVQEVETPAAGEVEPGSEPTLIQGVTETPEPVEPSLVETEAEAPIEAMDSGLPDWLKEISGEPNVPGTIEQTPEAEEAPEPLELPEWLTTMGAESPAAAEAQTETTGPEPEELAQTPIEEILPIEPAETGPETITVWDEQGATQIQVSAPLEENIPGVNLEDQDAAMAWLESLAARQGAAEEELTSRPEERLETPPAWVEELSGAEKPGEQPVEVEAQAEEPQEAAVELEATTAAVSEEAFEEIATPEAKEAPVPPAGGVELPDWLQEMAMEDVGAQPIQPTLPAEGPVESALPDWLQEISLEEEKPAPMEAQAQAEVESQAELASGQPAEMEIQPPAALSEEEAAMAWLETLAARQGVPEEELTTPPEERPETPPSWVQEQVASLQPPMEEQAVVGEQETIIETPAAAEIEAPAPVEEVEQPTVFEAPTAEQPAVEAMPVPEEAQPQVAEETPLPDWLQEMAAEEETPAAVEELFVEPAAAAEAPAPEQEPEAEPPLPAWLETVSEEEAVVEPGMPAGPLVDINTASLVELENLPGIGFILAQAIVNHREKHGPFNSIDDLADVAGFNPGIVAEIADRVTALPPAGPTTQVLPEIKELEGVSEYEAELVKARNAMVTGDIGNTLLHYGYLIKKNQLLAEVIRDLHEALYRYPVDANIWTVLGDAYMHNNQLQEALDTYIKAEELIR